jgi:hypothetical protein
VDFHAHGPQRGFGRSERALTKLAEDLTRFLTKTQRSLTSETLHLSGRQRETLAHIVVEFAEDGVCVAAEQLWEAFHNRSIATQTPATVSAKLVPRRRSTCASAVHHREPWTRAG